MNFAEARAQILSAIDFASGALNQEHIAQKLDKQDADIDFSELDLDSLAAMEVCMEIEDKTGIEIDLGDLAQHPSVNALAAFLAGKTTTNGR
jgi:acyl carrier protein